MADNLKLKAEPSASIARKGKVRNERRKITNISPQVNRKCYIRQTYRRYAMKQTKEGIALVGTMAVSASKMAVHGQDKDSKEDSIGSDYLASGSVSYLGNDHYGKKLKQSKHEKQSAQDFESHKGATAKQEQKRYIKKRYANTKRVNDAKEAAKKAGEGAKSVMDGASKALAQAANFIKDHAFGCLIAVLIGIVVFVLFSAVSTTMLFFAGTTNSMLAISYTAKDEDILTVESQYTSLEDELRKEVDEIEADHPGFDEYCYTMDAIEHDAHELASYLTILYEDYTPRKVKRILSEIADAQYELSITEVTEKRTRTETKYREETRYREQIQTGTKPIVGADGTVIRVPFEYTEMVPYTVVVSYEEEVEYEYSILEVTLKNHGIGKVVLGAGLSDEELERYFILLGSKGNKAYLF